MKESEYINATDLAKLRTAYTILSDVYPKTGTEDERLSVFGTLTKWIDEAEARVTTEDDVCSVCGGPLGSGYFYSAENCPVCADCVEDS